MSRRALITETDLRRMAKIVREQGVAFRGRVDALGGLTFSISPFVSRSDANDDDLDMRIAEFGSR